MFDFLERKQNRTFFKGFAVLSVEIIEYVN